MFKLCLEVGKPYISEIWFKSLFSKIKIKAFEKYIMIFCQKCHSIRTGKCGDPIKKGSVNCTHQNDGFIPHGCLCVIFLRLPSHSPFFISRVCSLFIKRAFLGCSAPQALQTLVAQGMTWGQLGHFFLLETMLSEEKKKRKLFMFNIGYP